MSKVVTPQTRSSTTGLRWVALVLALSQLVTPPIIMRVYGEFLSTGATNDAVITPARYAFSIWGLITLLCAVTCAAVVRLGLGAPWESRLLVDVSVVFVGFTGWLLIAAQNWVWLSVAVLAVMVAALVDAMRLLVRHAEDLTAPAWLRITDHRDVRAVSRVEQCGDLHQCRRRARRRRVLTHRNNLAGNRSRRRRSRCGRPYRVPARYARLRRGHAVGPRGGGDRRVPARCRDAVRHLRGRGSSRARDGGIGDVERPKVLVRAYSMVRVASA